MMNQKATLPTPDEMLTDLSALFPNFAHQWNSEDNLFRDESGYSYHELNVSQIRALYEYLEPFVRDDKVHDDIDNAICSCFLENLSGEPFSADLPKHLGANSLDFYRRWHGLDEV